MSKKRQLYVVLEIEMPFPPKQSVETLVEFSNVWQCYILSASTMNKYAQIGISWENFKSIWNKNPKKGYVEVPSGAEDFMEEVRIVEVCENPLK